MWLPLIGTLWFVGGFAIIVIALQWRNKRKGPEYPAPFTIRRAPGETLRRAIAKFDADMPQMLWIGLLPPILSLGTILIASQLPPVVMPYVTIGAVVVFLSSALYCGRWLHRFLGPRRELALGYFGERAVAECLESLMANSYWVYHDVPAKGSIKLSNLDHVTVGPTGVAVVETKTQDKGSALAGRESHIVTFDGNQLIWPWGENKDGIQQTIDEAEWLKKWLKKHTDLDVPVKPILTFPGWWVNEKPSEQLRVVNLKNLTEVVRGNCERVITAEDIDLICRQLDSLCRDVDD